MSFIKDNVSSDYNVSLSFKLTLTCKLKVSLTHIET